MRAAPLPRARQRGFSLLEVLVAFVILTLVVTALFRLFSGALANGSLADEYSRAALMAESRLALIAAPWKFREGGEQGLSEDGRFSWSTKIEQYTPPGMLADGRLTEIMPTRLWHLAVTVSWPNDRGGTRSIALSTVRVGSKE